MKHNHMTLFCNWLNGSSPLQNYVSTLVGLNKSFAMKALKIFLSKTTRHRALIFDM